jgi:hypothetical protein
MGLHNMHSSSTDTRQPTYIGVVEAAATALPMGWNRGVKHGCQHCSEQQCIRVTCYSYCGVKFRLLLVLAWSTTEVRMIEAQLPAAVMQLGVLTHSDVIC